MESHIEETWTFYRLPLAHHKHLKSTNLLERFNQEIKRRTLVVRNLFTHQLTIKEHQRAQGHRGHLGAAIILAGQAFSLWFRRASRGASYCQTDPTVAAMPNPSERKGASTRVRVSGRLES